MFNKINFTKGLFVIGTMLYVIGFLEMFTGTRLLGGGIGWVALIFGSASMVLGIIVVAGPMKDTLSLKQFPLYIVLGILYFVVYCFYVLSRLN